MVREGEDGWFYPALYLSVVMLIVVSSITSGLKTIFYPQARYQKVLVTEQHLQTP
jgi:hypothetical protein